MLKILQTGVNNRTKTINKLDEGDKRKTMAVGTAKKQARVEELTRKLARKLQKEEDPDGEDR